MIFFIIRFREIRYHFRLFSKLKCRGARYRSQSTIKIQLILASHNIVSDTDIYMGNFCRYQYRGHPTIFLQDGYGPIHIAVENNYIDVVKFLLENQVSVQEETTDKLTPLHIAAKSGLFQMTCFLLKSKANVHKQNKVRLT